MSKKENNKELEFLENYKVIAVIILGTVFLTYLYSKTGLQFTISTASDMGAIGDFFGGLLNPVFALIGLFALLATIKIQSKALKISSEELVNSRKELELTRGELEKSAIAQQEQSQSIKLQNFENTFFKMIDVYNSIVFDLSLDKFEDATQDNGLYNISFLNKEIDLKKNENVKEKETIKKLVTILRAYKKVETKEYKLIYDKFHQHYEDKIGHYFGFIYQVLIFIKDAEENNKVEDAKKYAHLFRSLFSKYELALLSYHCLGSIGSKKFKGLVEHFEFFEHLPINILTHELILMYDKNVFGKNEKWHNKIKKLAQ